MPAISGVCANCFFLKTIPYNVYDPNAGAVTQNISVCVNKVPKTEHVNPNRPPTQLGRAAWAIIDFPNDWTCGEGADATTGESYSKGVQGPAGPAGAGYSATSTTSLSVTNSGTRIFTTAAGLAYTAGARVRATAQPTGNWMEGIVGSYSGTTLSVNMDLSDGTSGSYSSWSINLAGQPGSAGTAGMVLLAALVASNSTSLADTTHITGAYDLYEIVLEDVVAVNAGAGLVMQVSTDGGATWKSSSYGDYSYTGTAGALVSNLGSSMQQNYSTNPGATYPYDGGISSTAGKGLSGTLRLFGPNQIDRRKKIIGWVSFTDAHADNEAATFVAAYWDGNTAVSGVRFLMTSGNISTGKIRIYGINTT